MLRVVGVRPAASDDDDPVLVVIEDEPFRFLRTNPGAS
jgi:hypothetical protein